MAKKLKWKRIKKNKVILSKLGDADSNSFPFIRKNDTFNSVRDWRLIGIERSVCLGCWCHYSVRRKLIWTIKIKKGSYRVAFWLNRKTRWVGACEVVKETRLRQFFWLNRKTWLMGDGCKAVNRMAFWIWYMLYAYERSIFAKAHLLTPYFLLIGPFYL